MSPVSGVDTSRLLVAAMKTCRERHRVLSSNIANADTPNYNPVEVDFQGTLKAMLEGSGRVELRRTQPAHLEKGISRPGTTRLARLAKNDYNKVDLEDQMAKLAENTGQFVTFSSLMAKQFEQVKNMLANIR